MLIDQNIEKGYLQKIVSKIREFPTTERRYSLDRLWSQRNRQNSAPLLLDIKGPQGQKLGIGLRDVREYLGKNHYIVGVFNLNGEQPTPIAYLATTRNDHQNTLYSKTTDSRYMTELKNDKVFSPLLKLMTSGRTIEVDWEYQRAGLGSQMILAMLDIGKKVNAPGLLFADVSGELSRLCANLSEKNLVSLTKEDRSGNLYLRKK